MTTEITRRAFVTASVVAGIAPLFARSSLAENACKMELAPLAAKPEKAVSLKEVSRLLAAGMPAPLGGLTRLDGYVIDDDNKDIVLFGVAERGQPELQVADFVVALRSAFRQDEVYRKSAAISIDSDPEYYRRVEHLQTATPEGRRRYQELCALSDLRRVRVD